jgi:hypothetical protein
MIDFVKHGELLVLQYKPKQSVNWVIEKLNSNQQVILIGIFTLSINNLYGNLSDFDNYDNSLPAERPPVEFVLARLENEYFRFDSDVLGISFQLFIHKDIKISIKLFSAERNISVFKKIGEIIKDNEVYIGGDRPYSIPEREFNNILRDFPSGYEIRKYVNARMGAVLGHYFNTAKDEEEKYNSYINKKKSRIGADVYALLKENEIKKYEIISQELNNMLASEDQYTEKQWQDEILRIILLLYPKYIHVFKEVKINDVYTRSHKRLDFMLVDSTGNIDLVEIKKPFSNCIVTNSKYRDNYIPLRELSGTVMQVEKYIFILNKWSKAGEEKLTNTYNNKLNGLEIKIINPCGMIIMGRDKNLSKSQIEDFNVIKRKYRNIIDIITYDDLLRRLKFTIMQLTRA